METSVAPGMHNPGYIVTNGHDHHHDRERIASLALLDGSNERFGLASIEHAGKQGCESRSNSDRNHMENRLHEGRHFEKLIDELCTLRATVLEKAHCTENLIREMESNRVRDELARAREELQLLRLRSSLPPPLVGAVSL